MIVVFGSINMDMNFWVGHLPKPGETSVSPFHNMSPGGKGANQALAAARLGVKTALVGRVGDDAMATRIHNNLRRNEVLSSGVATSETMPTGMAIIMRDSKGNRQVIIISGANLEISAEQVPDEILIPGNFLLLQMEVPLEQTLAVARRAKAHGATVVFNLAPGGSLLPKEALECVDYLIVNELEAHQMAETMHATGDEIKVAQTLARAGHLTCIVTLGSGGAVAVTADNHAWKLGAMKLDKIVDTSGAGDCFCGTLTACLHSKMPLPEALKRASVAAGLSCLKKGTQESFPYSGDIEEHLKALPDAVAVTLK